MDQSCNASSSSKRRRLSPSSIDRANPPAPYDSNDESDDSTSYVQLKHKRTVRPNAATNEPMHDYRADQLEESAILWAIDDIGLQNFGQNVAAVPSPMPISSSSDDDASSIESSETEEMIVAPIERTSDYSSTSDEEEFVAEPNDPDSERLDFMEAAVAVAIQKKGLLPHSIEMSPNR